MLQLFHQVPVFYEERVSFGLSYSGGEAQGTSRLRVVYQRSHSLKARVRWRSGTIAGLYLFVRLGQGCGQMFLLYSRACKQLERRKGDGEEEQRPLVYYGSIGDRF